LKQRILPKNRKNLNYNKKIKSICLEKNNNVVIHANAKDCALFHQCNTGIISMILNKSPSKKYYKEVLSGYDNLYYTIQYLEDDITPKAKFEKQYNVLIDSDEEDIYNDLLIYNDNCNNSIDV
jgi:hypothetical protein